MVMAVMGVWTGQVSYIKAMDIFLGTCFFYCFLSLMMCAMLKFIKVRNPMGQICPSFHSVKKSEWLGCGIRTLTH